MQKVTRFWGKLMGTAVSQLRQLGALFVVESRHLESTPDQLLKRRS